MHIDIQKTHSRLAYYDPQYRNTEEKENHGDQYERCWARHGE